MDEHTHYIQALQATLDHEIPITRQIGRLDFTAICHKPHAAQVEQFARILREKGKGHLEVRAEIREHHSLAMSFKGRYVALRTNTLYKER